MAEGEEAQPLPVNDPTIPDNRDLWRRIHPTQIILDGQGGKRTTSAAFRNSTDGSFMSVVIGEEGVTVERVLDGNVGFGVVIFTAGFARSLNQTVIRKPQPSEPLHGEVCGEKTDSVRRAFQRGSRLAFVP